MAIRMGILALAAACGAQDSAPSQPGKNDPLAAFTTAQKDSFSEAAKEFDREHYAAALAGLKPLVAELPAGTSGSFTPGVAAPNQGAKPK